MGKAPEDRRSECMGYTGQPFADGVRKRLKATVQVVKRNELHAFVVLPKRWIVEHSFA